MLLMALLALIANWNRISQGCIMRKKRLCWRLIKKKVETRTHLFSNYRGDRLVVIFLVLSCIGRYKIFTVSKACNMFSSLLRNGSRMRIDLTRREARLLLVRKQPSRPSRVARLRMWHVRAPIYRRFRRQVSSTPQSVKRNLARKQFSIDGE